MPNSLIASLLFQIVYQLSLGHSDPESFAKSSSSVSSLKIFHQLYFSQSMRINFYFFILHHYFHLFFIYFIFSIHIIYFQFITIINTANSMELKTLSSSQIIEINQKEVLNKGKKYQVSRNSANETSLPKIKHRQKLQKNIKNLLSQPNQQTQEQSFVGKYSWLCKQKQYFAISDQDIKEQNKQLKAALIQINDKVDKTFKDMQPRIERRLNQIVFNQKWKQRTKTEAEFLTHKTLEHRKKIQSMEASNNEFVIKIYKKQYRKLKNRQKYILGEGEDPSDAHDQNEKQKQKTVNKSSLFQANSRVRERLQSHIQQTVDFISKTKVVNRKIKERNKTLGNSIHSTDEFILNMKKLLQDVELQQKKKKKLEKKARQAQMNITQVYRKLHTIESQWSTAQQYLQKVNKKQRRSQVNKQKQEELKKKQVCKELWQKKKEFELQNNQVSYHNALKNLDKAVQSIKVASDKIKEIESANMHLKNEINYLQTTLDKIRMIKKQQLNKKRTGLMLLSNQLFSESDLNSQKSSMHVNKHMGELLTKGHTKPNAQVQTQTNEAKLELNECECESLLQQNKNGATIKYVNNESETIQ